MDRDLQTLKKHGVQPSAQRLAVARYVLHTTEHPSAERVFARVRRGQPTLSRATVYNTLNLFVRRGLLRAHALKEGRTVFDANLERHHHLVDAETGAITDLPWESFGVSGVEQLAGIEILDYQVVVRGRRRDPGQEARSGSARSERRDP